MINSICVDLIISGKVQGVGYRNFIKKKAESLGIVGYVKNKNDGSVFIKVQGEKNDIKTIIECSQRGTPNSIVQSVKTNHRHLEHLLKFYIVY